MTSADLFEAVAARPTAVASPPSGRTALQAWWRTHADDAVPCRSALDPADLMPMLSRIGLLEGEDGAWTARLIGTELDEIFGVRLTGRSLRGTDGPLRDLIATVAAQAVSDGRLWQATASATWDDRGAARRIGIAATAAPLLCGTEAQRMTMAVFALDLDGFGDRRRTPVPTESRLRGLGVTEIAAL